MSDKGYVYVLVNPSMEGYVKIGKTKRKPEVRVQELSQATGVPTPFILAYAACVNDCGHAETYLHTFFETKGKRVSGNREFFDVTTTEAIDAIHQYQNEFGIAVDNGDIEDDTVEDNEHPGLAISLQADRYYQGIGETLQDYKEAFSLYQQASKLGYSEATRQIARMYLFGESVIADKETALDYFKLSLKQGEFRCYGDMANIYFHREHLDNALKCVDLYMKNVEEISPWFVLDYISEMYSRNLPIGYMNNLKLMKEEILIAQKKKILTIREINPNANVVISKMLKIEEYMEYIFATSEDEDILGGIDYSAMMWKKQKEQEEQKKQEELEEQKKFKEKQKMMVGMIVSSINFYMHGKFPKECKLINTFGIQRYITIQEMMNSR